MGDTRDSQVAIVGLFTTNPDLRASQVALVGVNAGGADLRCSLSCIVAIIENIILASPTEPAAAPLTANNPGISVSPPASIASVFVADAGIGVGGGGIDSGLVSLPPYAVVFGTSISAPLVAQDSGISVSNSPLDLGLTVNVPNIKPPDPLLTRSESDYPYRANEGDQPEDHAIEMALDSASRIEADVLEQHLIEVDFEVDNNDD